MITLFHEVRHAYQGYCFKTQSKEAKNVLDQWEYEFNNYIVPFGKNNEVDDEAYLKQAIVIDAIMFAHKMMLEKFNVKTMIPKAINDYFF